MTDASSQHPALWSRSAALVTPVEGLEVQAETAFIAGELQRLGVFVKRVPVDFCTDEEAYQSTLGSLRPDYVVIPYATELREVTLHLAELARKSVAGPVFVTGDALAREPDPPASTDGVTIVPGPAGASLAPRLAADLPPIEDLLASTSADLMVFGGPELLRQPTGASLFGELGCAGLFARRPARPELAPTAFLARLEAPVPGAAVALEKSAALAPLPQLGSPVERIEWWDRDAGADVLALVADVRARGIRQSIRWMPGRHDPSELRRFAEAGIDRVIFELDRLEAAPPAPGSAATAADLAPHAEAARAAGAEVGILLVVGLPGETVALGEARLEAVRRLRPDRLRCIAFEPTGGHPVFELLRGQGAWPPKEDRWIRDVHRPLIQDCLPPDDFAHNWSEALLLLAEIEAGRSAGDAPQA